MQLLRQPGEVHKTQQDNEMQEEKAFTAAQVQKESPPFSLNVTLMETKRLCVDGHERSQST